MSSISGLERIDDICNKLKDVVKELEKAVTEEEEKQLSEEEQWRRYLRQREVDRLRRQRAIPAGHNLPILNRTHVSFTNSLRGW